MYKVIVKSSGKHNNVVLGARYCLTKRSANKLAKTFTSCECDFDMYKLVRIHGDIFCWSFF